MTRSDAASNYPASKACTGGVLLVCCHPHNFGEVPLALWPKRLGIIESFEESQELIILSVPATGHLARRHLAKSSLSVRLA